MNATIRSLKKAAVVFTGAAAVGLGGLSFAAEPITVNGAGATFPYPIYSKWFDEYHKLHPDIQFNYQSIGSGGGIRQVTEHTVDFGASDGPMTDEQLKKVDVKVLHIPTVLGAVVPVYNVEGVSGLKLTGEALAGIYLGKITRWNDPALRKINPGARLPDAAIAVVHRADGSGTTYCFADYLSKVSPEWEKSVGRGTAVNWPTGLGGKGNEGVAGLVKQTPGAIGYVELIYAIQNKLDYASVANKAGKFIKADLPSVSAAAAGAAKNMPKDYRVSITNAPGPKAYPISTFTWLLVYRTSPDSAKGKVIKDFLGWMLERGQAMATDLAYAPLPPNVKAMLKRTIQSVDAHAGS